MTNNTSSTARAPRGRKPAPHAPKKGLAAPAAPKKGSAAPAATTTTATAASAQAPKTSKHQKALQKAHAAGSREALQKVKTGLLALGHEVPEDLFEEGEEAPAYKKRRLTQGQESHMSELRERLDIAKGAYKLLREQVDRAVDAAKAAEERVEVAKKAAGEARDKISKIYERIRSIRKEAEEADQPLLE